MAEVTLANLRFLVPSPSLLYLLGWPSIQLAFVPGHQWRVVIRNEITAHGYGSRLAAAEALARAMQQGVNA